MFLCSNYFTKGGANELTKLAWLCFYFGLSLTSDQSIHTIIQKENMTGALMNLIQIEDVNSHIFKKDC